MGTLSKAATLGALAAAAAVAAVAARSPGAWSLAACWGALGAGSALWARAQGADERAKRASDMASQAFAKGARLEGEAGSLPDVKSGVLMAMGSLGCFLAGALALLGCFAVGWAWGVGASLPVGVLGMAAWRAMERDYGHP